MLTNRIKFITFLITYTEYNLQLNVFEKKVFQILNECGIKNSMQQTIAILHANEFIYEHFFCTFHLNV